MAKAPELTDQQVLRLTQAALEFNATIVAICASTIALKSKKRNPQKVTLELTQAFSDYQKVARDVVKSTEKKTEIIT